MLCQIKKKKVTMVGIVEVLLFLAVVGYFFNKSRYLPPQVLSRL